MDCIPPIEMIEDDSSEVICGYLQRLDTGEKLPLYFGVNLIGRMIQAHDPSQETRLDGLRHNHPDMAVHGELLSDWK